ncbi:MAG: MepB family protein [Bacteroidia bacterium]
MLNQINKEVYQKCGLKIAGYRAETESREYDACRYELNGLKIISRTAKITPKKAGQFVTFWKRNSNGVIEPFAQNDNFNFYVVNLRTEKRLAQFVFQKAVLIKHGIVSSDKNEGKRAFRVYPPWDMAINKQAARTQKWQLDYFYEINELTEITSTIHQKLLALFEPK